MGTNSPGTAHRSDSGVLEVNFPISKMMEKR
jgi:hypothetical protein